MGRSISHKRGVAGKRWKKRAPVTPKLFKPNLQKATIAFGNQSLQVKLCTKCLKRYKKDNPAIATSAYTV